MQIVFPKYFILNAALDTESEHTVYEQLIYGKRLRRGVKAACEFSLIYGQSNFVMKNKHIKYLDAAVKP